MMPKHSNGKVPDGLLQDLIENGDPIWAQMCGGNTESSKANAEGTTRGRLLDVLALFQSVGGKVSGDGQVGGDGNDGKETALVEADLLQSLLNGFQDGLSFIREVEKGSHLKAESLGSFRVEAVGSCCGIVEEEVQKALQTSDEIGKHGDDGDAGLGDDVGPGADCPRDIHSRDERTLLQSGDDDSGGRQADLRTRREASSQMQVESQHTNPSSNTTSAPRDHSTQTHQVFSTSRKRLEDVLRQLVYDYRQKEKKAQKKGGKKGRR